MDAKIKSPKKTKKNPFLTFIKFLLAYLDYFALFGGFI